MFKNHLLLAIIIAGTGCGGGDSSDDDLQFGTDVPSEATLCTFTIGVTTRDQIEAVLGEPTNFNDDPSGASVQYWYGNAAVTFDLKVLLVGFDEEGIFESALTTQIAYPQCWREQEDALSP
jgi:hypothetical protein